MLGIGNSLIYSSVISDKIYVNSASIDFNGTDEYAEASNYTALSPGAGGATGYSVSIWVYSQHSAVGDMKQDRIIGKVGPAGDEWVMTIDGGGRARFFLYFDNDTNNRYRIHVNSALSSVNTWYHLVFTWDATKDTDDATAVTMYVNGTKSNSASGATVTVGDSDSETVTASSQKLEIARSNDGNSGHYWNGLIDEISIFNITLDEDAVTQIYNSGTPIDMTVDTGNYDNSSNLVGYWRMGEDDSGTTITNLSSTAGATDMTLYNSPSFETSEYAGS